MTMNKEEVKQNVKNVDTWLRGLFIIVFGIIFYALYAVLWVVILLQFFTKVLTGTLNAQISGFSVGLTNYAFQILNYMTFQSEERPWPFSPWPQN